MIKLVTDYVVQSAALYPDKTAYVSENRTITFSEVCRESQQIGSGLIRKGLFHKPVAILMDKGIDCILSMLGTAFSGNFYTILDTSMPDARIQIILDTLQPSVILTGSEHTERAAGFTGNHEVVLFNDLKNQSINLEALKERRFNALASDILYVLFTSGSTGVPKGVTTSHAAVQSYLEWSVEFLHLDDTMILANQAPFYFVMSTFDIYMPYLTGGTTHLVPKIMYSFPMMLLTYLKENHVNFLYYVTSVMCIVANLGALSEIHLDDLKLACFGGEVMPARQMNMWKKEYPNVTFYNMWGATETTDWGTYYLIENEIPETESIPLGYSCGNQDIFLLNDKDELVTGNELGEICIKSPTLAYGYYNDPEKTAGVFVQNPLQKAFREIIYRTGDLGTYNAKGELIYAGRKDFQIKHMGHRIELGEIETAASSLKGIQRCCCLYSQEKDRIVLFYTGSAERTDVKEELKNLIPEYMVPTKIMHLQEMPFNLNGKIHRQELKKLL